PFLREDMLDVAQAVVHASDPMVLHVTTNGSFPERIERFARSQGARLRVMVSFDGLDEEHDRNRGAAVSFAQAIETVERLCAAKIAVSVNHTVISARSLEDGVRLRERMSRLGVDVHSVLAYEDSAMYGIKLRGKRASALLARPGYPLHPALRGADVLGFV